MALGYIKRKLEDRRRKKNIKKTKGKTKTVAGFGKRGTKEYDAARQKALGIKSKIKKKDLADKGTKLTKAGLYPTYKKKSKSAGSFRAAFKSNCSGGKGGTFTWQGRSYSCARADDKKKTAEKVPKNNVKKGTNNSRYSGRSGRDV